MDTKVSISKNSICFTLTGINVLGALKSQIEIDFSNIVHSKVIDHIAVNEFTRFPTTRVGTFLPNAIAEGTFYKNKAKFFLNIHEGKSAIELQLQNHEYSFVVMELENSQEVANQLADAMQLSKNTN